jgi:hypothetical protein
MSAKKKSPASGSGGLPALRIGSRVRCTDDGVEGRIVWCNAVSVKVRWDDGEHVTWRRDSLAERPVEILDSAGEEDQATAGATPTDREVTVSTESPREEPPPTPTAAEDTTAESAQSVTETADPATEPATAEPLSPVPERSEGQTTSASADTKAETPVPPKRRRKAPTAPKEKKLSALDASAKVLAEMGTAMSCQEMIEVMAQKGYWASPNGRTPAATLYAAILRETRGKGADSRFKKTERGKFARTAAV